MNIKELIKSRYSVRSFTNEAIDIETRFYNYPGGEDECYTLTDLELIIFGEIQKGY